MRYNPEIHHRRSIRLQGYDYSAKGLYFVTLCVQDKRCLLGSIDDGQMRLNEIGEVADHCWREIPQHYPYVVLHEHIVMPNHVHGLIEIKDRAIVDLDGVSSADGGPSGEGVRFVAGVQDIEPQRGLEVHLQFHKIRWRQVWRQLAVGNALCYFYLGNMYNFWWMR